MDCQRTLRVVSAMVDREASAGEEITARRHLADCPACRGAAARMAAITRPLRVRSVTPARDLLAAVLQAVASRAAATEPGIAPHERLHRESGPHDQARRPACLPAHTVVWAVGTALCGCAAGCDCGCQAGRPCLCHAPAA